MGHNYDTIKCKLRGIIKKPIIEEIESQQELDQGIRWVSVKGVDFNLEAHEILHWNLQNNQSKNEITFSQPELKIDYVCLYKN